MFFIHIPKTAGTSLRKGAVDYLGEKKVALDYGPGKKATSRIIDRLVHQKMDHEAFRKAFDSKGFKFLSGHVSFADYIGFFDLDNVAVFLRDPTQRVVSAYRHFVRHHGYTLCLQSFASDPKHQNRQSLALRGATLESVGFVGLFEHFEESLQRLNDHFGWQIPPRKDNLGERRVSEPYQIDSSLHSFIKEKNQLDQEIYERAYDLFKNPETSSRKTENTENAPGFGRCRLYRGNILRGWACRVGAETASMVRVEINGAHHAMLRADRYRPEIQKLGLKRSGCVGFETSLPGLSKGDQIRCFENEGSVELENSPISVQ